MQRPWVWLQELQLVMELRSQDRPTIEMRLHSGGLGATPLNLSPGSGRQCTTQEGFRTTPPGPSQSYSVQPRLDPWYLRGKSFVDKLRERATQHFEENLGSIDSACILWEAFKTVMRGHTQDLIGGQKKERNMQAANLEWEIAALEARFAVDGEAEGDLQHQPRLKRYKLCTLAEQHTRAHALAIQRQLYDVGDKSN
ncbi:hypothetical protein NDU88_006116 [Pleurodeles waltl]|uniref:Retrotransposon gag domain-containing protein n=1 Tax=Pleurodeles waltl TaxID=8319 RepID=A0AAV7W9P8_PLEWA|nr:hypothetical protein NDU88_006116 [Pleurodeles waltl]